MDRQYLLVINYASRGLITAVEHLKKQSKFSHLSLLIVTSKKKYLLSQPSSLPIEVIQTNFERDLANQLKPYLSQIVGVVCRGDGNIQFLRKLVPLLPDAVHVASEQSLKTATDKKLMRQAFLRHCPEISPKFIEVTSLADIDKIVQEVGLPAILKPANLASSLLIRACRTRPQLEQALADIFEHIGDIYSGEGRTEKPKVIAEQLLDGDFYSIDAYVTDHDIFYCPPVGYLPANKIGVDDFFLYKRFIPSGLSASELELANQATKKAILAVGLKYSSAHVELIRTDSGWKVIELGPRIGRFRHVMYQQAYGIDHILNDVRIHLGLKPSITDQLINYCAAYSLYPHKEGTLSEIEGLDYLKTKPEIINLKISGQPGSYCRFAKNGGHAVGEFIVATKDKSNFDEITKFIDEKVAVVTK